MRRLITGVLGVVIAVVWVFYSATRSQSRTTVAEAALAPVAINSIQHSLGAAHLYALFYPTGVKPRLLGAGIEVLGHVNEWVEHAFKPNKDPTEEVYKDLRNNLVGLTAAKWLAEHYGWRISARQRRAVIADLAHSRELAYLRNDALVPTFGTGNQTGPAMDRYRQDRKAIALRTRMYFTANAERIHSRVKLAE
ncbi:MAG: hypothetical protein ABL893_08665 [Hyphomicrobium sp.]